MIEEVQTQPLKKYCEKFRRDTKPGERDSAVSQCEILPLSDQSMAGSLVFEGHVLYAHTFYVS